MNRKEYIAEKLQDVLNRDPDQQGHDASPNPGRKNELPKMRQPTEYSQNKQKGE